jgi:glycosyltransferase involved in cell wall biosynthesis
MPELIRVAIAARDSERCGVRDYARHLADAMPEGVEVFWVAYPDADSSAVWRRAAKATQGADVVHVHYEYGLFRLVKPLRNRFATFMDNLTAPAVVTLHGPLPSLDFRWSAKKPYGIADALRDVAYVPFRSRWPAQNHRRAAHWIVHTRALRDTVARYAGPDRVTLMAHPAPRVGSLWRGDSGRELRLVTPGFIKEHKGAEIFLETLRAMPEWRWTLAGGPQNPRDARFLARLRKRIDDLGLADRVEIAGYLSREELESLVCRHAMAVFPYERAEGSGSLALSIGLGMPVAATDLPSFREMREAGAGIEFLPRETPERWASVLQTLHDDPSRLERLAQVNRGFALSNSYEHAATQLAALFRSIAGRDARRRRILP